MQKPEGGLLLGDLTGAALDHHPSSGCVGCDRIEQRGFPNSRFTGDHNAPPLALFGCLQLFSRKGHCLVSTDQFTIHPSTVRNPAKKRPRGNTSFYKIC